MDALTPSVQPVPQPPQPASRGWRILFWVANGATALSAVSVLSILTFGLKAFRREPVSFRVILLSIGILAVFLIIQYLIARPVHDALLRNSSFAKVSVAIGTIAISCVTLVVVYIAVGEIFVLGQ